MPRHGEGPARPILRPSPSLAKSAIARTALVHVRLRCLAAVGVDPMAQMHGCMEMLAGRGREAATVAEAAELTDATHPAVRTIIGPAAISRPAAIKAAAVAAVAASTVTLVAALAPAKTAAARQRQGAWAHGVGRLHRGLPPPRLPAHVSQSAPSPRSC